MAWPEGLTQQSCVSHRTTPEWGRGHPRPARTVAHAVYPVTLAHSEHFEIAVPASALLGTTQTPLRCHLLVYGTAREPTLSPQ